MFQIFRAAFLFALIFCGFTATQAQSSANFYQVRTGADSGSGSLREAILNANENVTKNPQTQITFQIPVTDPSCNPKIGVCTIEILSLLPPVTANGIVFDGIAQNTIFASSSKSPKIQISGARLKDKAPGLLISASNCAIKGLAFSNFSSHAVVISGPNARGNRVMSCVFEKIRGCSLVISEGASGNFIGVAPPPTKNEDDDFISFHPTQMGNIFRAGGDDYICIAGQNSRGNSVRGNYFEENYFEGSPLPLNLRLDSEKSHQITPNDAQDKDSGPNDALNFPLIQSVKRAARTDGVWHEITLFYDGQPSQNLILDVYWEAQLVNDGTTKSQEVRTDLDGKCVWKMQVKGYPAGKMRAAVTDENGSTSEMSPAFDVPFLY